MSKALGILLAHMADAQHSLFLAQFPGERVNDPSETSSHVLATSVQQPLGVFSRALSTR